MIGWQERDWITVRYAGGQATWSGVFDRASLSLALLTFVGVPMRMGARVALAYGPSAALERLKALADDVVGIGPQDVVLEAIPTARTSDGSGANGGFRYAISRKS